MATESIYSPRTFPNFPGPMMSISAVTIKDRINACWMGKSIGGTLGMPFEGSPGPLDIWFYTPVPTGMLPNDDLDLQVVWAATIDQMTTPYVDRHALADAWQRHVDFPWDEYGVAKRNIALGLTPPTTGSYDNWFINGMGAAIRTELWACLAPGDPTRAASYAYEDACVDHAEEGIWAAMFLAALQAAAFVESDINTLISVALRSIPSDSQIAEAVCNVQRWAQQSNDWRHIRAQILELYDHANFTDVTANIAFIVMSWLVGGGDFGKTICIANNCGRDTDCTAATVGALLGIIDPQSIPPRWIAPIGRSLVLSPQICGLIHPRTLDEFTDLILNLQPRLTPRPQYAGEPLVHERQLGIHARQAFMEQMPVSLDQVKSSLAYNARDVVFPGSVVTMAKEEFQSRVIILEYRIVVDSEQMIRVMLNTQQPCQVWIDDALAFKTAYNTVAPSFHRQSISSQIKDVRLCRGVHHVRASIEADAKNGASWIYGLANPRTCQWLPELMFQVKAPTDCCVSSL